MSFFSPGHPDDVLLITLDSCRYDTFCFAKTPSLDRIGTLYRAQAPSYFTYGSHSSIWMGFTPGLANLNVPWLNPKVAKLFRMQASAASVFRKDDAFVLSGQNIISGFKKLGFLTLGSGAVAWFDPSTETGAVLSSPFDHFYYPGNTWSLRQQLDWLSHHLSSRRADQPVFVFLNVGETHVPYWHEGANWPIWPSPCVPFGGDRCSRSESRRRQLECLQWVDSELSSLIEYFSDATILACADHGDCWGEDGLWEHGVSHQATLTVPLLIKVRGKSIYSKVSSLVSPSLRRKTLRKLYRLAQGIL
jgi:hypothetical protein